MKRSLTVLSLASAALLFVFTGTGCGQKPGDEPTKYRSQEGLEKLTMQAQAAATADNPKFRAQRNITPENASAKDIDSIIRPVLVRIFKDAKLVSAIGPEAPKVDGEVVEDRLLYSVKSIMTEPDGDKLHGAFRSVGFALSPRLGAKPTHSRGKVYMSLMKSTRQRGYSFVIIVDTKKQQVEVESYKLGSKYDRLM